jgi:hypothetical protein
VPAPRFEVDSVRAQRIGDVAIVEYRREGHSGGHARSHPLN